MTRSWRIWVRGQRQPRCRALLLGLLHGIAIAISAFAEEQIYPLIPGSSAEDWHTGNSYTNRAEQCTSWGQGDCSYCASGAEAW